MSLPAHEGGAGVRFWVELSALGSHWPLYPGLRPELGYRRAFGAQIRDRAGSGPGPSIPTL